jgi:hypothetical protein
MILINQPMDNIILFKLLSKFHLNLNNIFLQEHIIQIIIFLAKKFPPPPKNIPKYW